MSKFKIGKIYRLISSHPSFSWANGLKVCVACNDTEVHLCDIDKNGDPSLFEDKSFMCLVTGINNPGLYETKLSYELPPNFTFL